MENFCAKIHIDPLKQYGETACALKMSLFTFESSDFLR